jgi:hypothetical protein
MPWRVKQRLKWLKLGHKKSGSGVESLGLCANWLLALQAALPATINFSLATPKLLTAGEFRKDSGAVVVLFALPDFLGFAHFFLSFFPLSSRLVLRSSLLSSANRLESFESRRRQFVGRLKVVAEFHFLAFVIFEADPKFLYFCLLEQGQLLEVLHLRLN